LTSSHQTAAEIRDETRLDVIIVGAGAAGIGMALTLSKVPGLRYGFMKGCGVRQIFDLWDWNEEGRIALTDVDESTLSPGLFRVGPKVRRDQHIYYYIYKFRQRFALIARTYHQVFMCALPSASARKPV